jgi:alpha 1,2-mannosyltransferase
VLTILLTLALVALIPLSTYHDSGPLTAHGISAFRPVRATLPSTNKKRPDPIRWLDENSNNRYAVTPRGLPQVSVLGSRKPRAALISLVRNSELEGAMQSMRQLEYRWNRKYQVRPPTPKMRSGPTVICSTLGYFSTMSLSPKNSKQIHVI